MQTMFGSTARSARPRYCPTWKLGKSDRVISAEKSGHRPSGILNRCEPTDCGMICFK